MMILVASRKRVMGEFVIGPWLKTGGWFATGAMALNIAAMAGAALV
jgi:Mn2+/Fe2+ NRAMP family transporter